MNIYTAWALKNVAVVVVVGFAVWISKDPSALLGLIFLSGISANDEKEKE